MNVCQSRSAASRQCGSPVPAYRSANARTAVQSAVAVNAVEILDRKSQFGDPLALVHVAIVLGHAPQSHQALDAREITRDKPLGIRAADAARFSTLSYTGSVAMK